MASACPRRDAGPSSRSTRGRRRGTLCPPSRREGGEVHVGQSGPRGSVRGGRQLTMPTWCMAETEADGGPPVLDQYVRITAVPEDLGLNVDGKTRNPALRSSGNGDVRRREPADMQGTGVGADHELPRHPRCGWAHRPGTIQDAEGETPILFQSFRQPVGHLSPPTLRMRRTLLEGSRPDGRCHGTELVAHRRPPPRSSRRWQRGCRRRPRCRPRCGSPTPGRRTRGRPEPRPGRCPGT